MPASALGIAGGGTAAFLGDIGDQSVDIHYGYRKSLDVKKVATSGIVTAVTAGVGGVWEGSFTLDWKSSLVSILSQS